MSQCKDIELLQEAMRLCSVLAFNNFDIKNRISALAIEGGVAAIVENLLLLLQEHLQAQEVENAIMITACNLFKRLRNNGTARAANRRITPVCVVLMRVRPDQTLQAPSEAIQ